MVTAKNMTIACINDTNIFMRDNSVTYAKGVAIMLVVLGHACFETPVEWWVNFIHVPLFFFMSGYCFKEEYLDAPITFIGKRIRGLYLPFVMWGLFFLMMHNVFYSLGVYNSVFGYNGISTMLYSVPDTINRAFRILLFQYSERLLGGYWFLPSLFTGSVVFYITLKILRNQTSHGMTIIIGGGLFTISILLQQFNISVYLLNSRNILAAIFIFLGYAYRKNNCQIHQQTWFICFSLIGVSLGVAFWRSSMVSFTTCTIIPYILTATCGLLAIFGICTRLSKMENKYLDNALLFIGNNTLSTLTWHMTAFVLVNLLIIKVYNINPKRLAEFPVIKEFADTYWGLVYFTVAMLACCIIAYIGRRITISLRSKWHH